jgi:hypothetical protein
MSRKKVVCETLSGDIVAPCSEMISSHMSIMAWHLRLALKKFKHHRVEDWGGWDGWVGG